MRLSDVERGMITTEEECNHLRKKVLFGVLIWGYLRHFRYRYDKCLEYRPYFSPLSRSRALFLVANRLGRYSRYRTCNSSSIWESLKLHSDTKLEQRPFRIRLGTKCTLIAHSESFCIISNNVWFIRTVYPS